MSQAGVLRGVASVGIATSVFGHEIQSAIAAFRASGYTARDLAREGSNEAMIVDELTKALEHAEHVHAWGSFALRRVRRDKRRRRKLDLARTVLGIIDDLQRAYDAASIDLQHRLEEANIRSFEMDMESVTMNLLTNAYVACQQSRRPRKILVQVQVESHDEREGVLLSVSDSGPGVPKPFLEKVWQPLFTTRKGPKGTEVGTGLGLAIVDSIVNESGGYRRISRDKQLRGARFDIWFPRG